MPALREPSFSKTFLACVRTLNSLNWNDMIRVLIGSQRVTVQIWDRDWRICDAVWVVDGDKESIGHYIVTYLLRRRHELKARGSIVKIIPKR